MLALLLPLLLFAVNYWQDPILAKQYFSYEQLVKLIFFVPMGIWLGGRVKRIYAFWVLVLAGLLLALLQVDTITSFQNIFAGKRVDFAINNAQHTAMFFGLAVILLLVCFKPLVASQLAKSSKIGLLLLWCICDCIDGVYWQSNSKSVVGNGGDFAGNYQAIIMAFDVL